MSSRTSHTQGQHAFLSRCVTPLKSSPCLGCPQFTWETQLSCHLTLTERNLFSTKLRKGEKLPHDVCSPLMPELPGSAPAALKHSAAFSSSTWCGFLWLCFAVCGSAQTQCPSIPAPQPSACLHPVLRKGFTGITRERH